MSESNVGVSNVGKPKSAAEIQREDRKSVV